MPQKKTASKRKLENDTESDGQKADADKSNEAKKDEKARRQLEKFAVDKDEEDGEGEEKDDMGNRPRYRGYQPKNQNADDQADKPKYDKSKDFFDCITNSSLEQKRGGYRGRGRGGFNNRDDAFGGRDGQRDNWQPRGGRGGYDRNQRGGRGGRNNDYDRNRPNTGGFGEFRKNAGHKKYSEKLADPNDVNYGKTEEEKEGEADKNTGFYDKYKNADDAVKAYERSRRDNRRKKDDKNDGEGYRGGRGQEQRGGRGGRPNTAVRGGGGWQDSDRGSRGGERGGQRRGGGRGRGGMVARRDEETFGESSARNFKFENPDPAAKRGRRQKKEKAGEESKGADGAWQVVEK